MTAMRDAGVLRPRWTRADDDAVELPGRDLLDADLVVARDLDVGAQLAQVLVEVVGERVVVVEQQDAQARARQLVVAVVIT